MSSPKPTLLVEVELSGAGSGFTDITSDVLRGSVEIEHGIQGSGPTDRVASTGTARFSLDNSAGNSGHIVGYYSTFGVNRRSGWGLGIGCRVKFTDPASGTLYARFVGRIDAIDPVPGTHGPRSVAITAVDWMDEAARWNLTPVIGPQVLQTDDQILTAILAQMPFQPSAISFAAGVETYPYALDSSSNTKQSALAEFQKLMMSGFGRLYVKADGTLKSDTRYTRILGGLAGTVWNLTDTDLVDLQCASSRDQIMNYARVTIHQKLVETGADVVYHADGPIFIGVGETLTVFGDYSSPTTTERFGAIDVQQPLAYRDWQANVNVTGDGLDKTTNVVFATTPGPSGVQFDISNPVVAGNTDGGAWILNLQLLGRRVHDQGDLVFEDSDATSITDVGERVVDIDMPYQANRDVGQGAAHWLIDRLNVVDPHPNTFTVVADTSALLTAMLQRDISDYVQVTETVSGLNNVAFINGELLTLEASGYLRGTYTLTTDTGHLGFGDLWVLDISTLGVNTELFYF